MIETVSNFPNYFKSGHTARPIQNPKTCYTPPVNSPATGQPTFFGLGIAPRLLEALQRLGFQTPTPIQHQSIPIAIEGKDVIGVAQTGTGKTLAFGIPMLQRLASVKGQGLILLPTRELAMQVDETLQKLGRGFGLRTALVIGGASMHLQIQKLRARPHVIIATPGRLNDHLQQRTASVSEVRILVLDEADRMLDMGFAPQINKILEHVPRQRQTMLFSATMPAGIVEIAKRTMQLPLRVEVAPPGTAAERVEHEVFFVRKDEKTRLLEKILSEYRGTVLVFTRTKFAAKKLASLVRRWNHTAAELHSNRTLAQRRHALDGFKSGAFRVLVATDIAARGIDVTGIELVVNFDLPSQAEDYVHRIGRTARAGRAGKAVSFAQPEQQRDVRDIERLIRLKLPVSRLPELPTARQLPPEAYTPERQYSQRPRRNFRGGRGRQR